MVDRELEDLKKKHGFDTSVRVLQELNAIKQKHGYEEPDRGNLDDPRITWRYMKPNFTKVNLAYFKGRSKAHPEGSLEKIVENLVKMWEMEASHKIDLTQWNTIEPEKYWVSANDGKVFVGEEAKDAGNYNSLLDGINKRLYDVSAHTFESSHDLFRSTFKDGFPWELLHVLSGPPKLVFSWRHWGTFNGEYKGRKGDGNVYEMYGTCIVGVSNDLKIQSLEVYFKPEDFLAALEGVTEELRAAKNIMGNGCPILAHSNCTGTHDTS